jgi:hypothetical protein
MSSTNLDSPTSRCGSVRNQTEGLDIDDCIDVLESFAVDADIFNLITNGCNEGTFDVGRPGSAAIAAQAI